MHADGFTIPDALLVIPAHSFQQRQKEGKLSMPGLLQEIAGTANTHRFEIVEIPIGKNMYPRRQTARSGRPLIGSPVDFVLVHDEQIKRVVAIWGFIVEPGAYLFCRTTSQNIQTQKPPRAACRIIGLFCVYAAVR
jgi:hypothetical protein